MNEADIYKHLEKDFLATVIGELMPGILHNFANPLNGIMGRAKLLQRRSEDMVRKIEAYCPGLAQEMGQEKITSDINAIVSETDRFYAIYRGLAEKISLLSAREPEKINVSRLIEKEVRFADFYLDFKHDFKKHLDLDFTVPEITGNPAHYSLCISALLQSSRERMKDCPEKEISVSAGYDASCISVTFQDNGSPIPGKLTGPAEQNPDCAALPESAQGLYYALALLKQKGVRIHINSESGHNAVSLSIGYR